MGELVDDDVPCCSRRLVDVGGHSTEIYCIDADPGAQQQPAQLHVLLIPGNPGLAGFYVPFLRSLHARLGGAGGAGGAGVALTAVSHLGQHPGCAAAAAGRTFSLEEQVAHKVAFAQQHLLGVGAVGGGGGGVSASGGGAREGPPPPARLLVVGHSIGAYIAVHTVARLRDAGHVAVLGGGGAGDEGGSSSGAAAVVPSVVGLMPFLATNPACSRQALLRRATAWPSTFAALARALRWLPDALLRRLVALQAGAMDEHAVRCALTLLTPHVARACFALGASEFASLSGPMDWRPLEALGGALSVHWCEGDMWCRADKAARLSARLPAARVHLEAGCQRHDFCVSRELSDALAARVLGELGLAGPAGEAEADAAPASQAG